MAGKKKNFWYVMVMTGSGPVFVTSVNHVEKMAHWDKDKNPIELGEFAAKDLAMGLMCNMTTAYPVCSPIEIEHQPYLYSHGQFKWEPKEEE